MEVRVREKAAAAVVLLVEGVLLESTVCVVGIDVVLKEGGEQLKEIERSQETNKVETGQVLVDDYLYVSELRISAIN